MEAVLYLRIVKTIIGIFGMIGNTLVCVVIYYNREMHTLTNVLIFHQAAIDFLSCILIFLQSNIPDTGPPESEVAGQIFCKFWQAPVVLFALLTASTFNLVVVTLERYTAIVFPFRYMRLFTRTINVILICCVWLVAAVYKLPDIARYYYDADEARCSSKRLSWVKVSGIVTFCVQYFVPILVMVFAYGHIIRVLSKNQGEPEPVRPRQNTNASTENGPHAETLQESQKRARRNVFKTLLLVFIAFAVCWTPNQFFFLLYNLGANVVLNTPLHRMTILIAQSNSAVNFLIYGFKYKQFRHGLKKLFRCKNSIEPYNSSSAHVNTVSHN